MDINDILGTGKSYGQNRVGSGQTAEISSGSGSGKARGSAGSSDTVTLSGDAKLFAQAVRDAQSDSGVRTDRVAELKALVESGEYQPDSRKIAEKLLLSEIDLLS
ncbi:flagellar biosynthesis anti-sigma factor FlgM [Desulfolutivibrio sulfoxidireducens]|uniref:flagellar biosynthesis anti-sigma factor FlgM n=1 Tax=Desulfolutivibrio sulfoxidireducens TaxID=2773299 RepID=UPI00159E2814|nr:flagellar biosynthesis anti-sigma factor FlgM [Desulfolutivibrio sulfoxidireducens]QLA20420.1 flagellar biosynthesis anti-sigma factor FlgM [Desulfolutivibrio sulfoxidireducens]